MGTLRLAPSAAVFVLALSFPAFGQQPSALFAHVAFVEGAASLERDGNVEALDTGVPLVAGDRLRTTDGRLEIRFENGSTLYVDQSSTLDILSTDSLRLPAGTIRFDVAGNRPYIVPLYRVDTPAASVTIDAPGEYRVMAETGRKSLSSDVGVEKDSQLQTVVQVVRGTANLTTDNGGTTVRSGEQSTVAAGELPSFPVRFNSARWDAFGQWVELRRSGRGVLSVSQHYLPPVIRSYAGTLDRYGTWITDAQFGVVWYPTVGGWRPYHAGRWAWIAPFGWTWVGAEAWAWPTLHYGRWCLSANGSWFWIPGNSWGTAAPIIAQLQTQSWRGSSGRFFRDPPGVLTEQPPPVLPGGTISAPVQHDPLARRLLPPISQSPIGLPFPSMGLSRLHQGIAQTVPSVGTTPQMQFGSAWAGRAVQQRPTAPRTVAPQPHISPRAAPGHPSGNGWSAPGMSAPRGMAAPRAIPSIVPPATSARPQLGTWGSIGAPSPAAAGGSPIIPQAGPLR